MSKKRLDIIVYELGLAESREKAKALIMSGMIYADNQKSDKPGTLYSEDTKIELRGNKLPYVSRGGLKLEKAIHTFSLNLSGKITMDIGASTGGFTDCMLQNGAVKVYSVDVGYGQLAWKLRNDERVINLERTNARYLTHEQIPDNINFFSVDVAFISLCLVLEPIYQLLSENGEGVCLIKPQFEAGREKVGKNGVVRDPNVHIEVIEKIYRFCIEHNFTVLGLDYSPIKGPEGNIEYLIHIRRSNGNTAIDSISIPKEEIEQLVKRSHDKLDI